MTNLSLTNMEVFIAVVDDVVLRAACSDETQSLKKQNKNRNDLHGSVLFKDHIQLKSLICNLISMLLCLTHRTLNFSLHLTLFN